MKRAIGAFAAILGILLAGERGDGQATTVNLVAYWPLDTVGATSPDAVGPHTLTNVASGATATTGFVAGGSAHDATDYFTAADAAGLDFGTGSFTVAAWIRPTSTASVRLINKWVAGEQGWLFDIHSTTGGAAQVGSLRMRLDSNAAGNTAADNIDITVAAGLTGNGTWQHVAAVVDRTANQLRVYRNGVQVGTSAAIAATLGDLSNTAVLGIGTIPASLGKYYAGTLDEVRLYNRALTAADVLTLVAPLPPVVVDPPAVGNGSVTLNWGTSPGATSYQVYISTTSGTGYLASGAPIAGTTLTVTGLTNGTPYYFVVTADNGYAESAYSNEVTGTPLAPPPRTNSHDEGLLGDKCSCGSTVPGPLPLLPAFLAGLALLAFRRR